MGKSRGKSALALACILWAGLGSFPATSQDGPPDEVVPWRILLTQQLKEEKSCDLLEVLMFDESAREGQTIIEGKISCRDGRQFDFARPRPHQKFEIKLCEPAVC